MPAIVAYSGIVRLNREDLEKLAADGQHMNIDMAGLLIVARDITPQLAEKAIGRVNLRGVLRASREIRSVLARKQRG